MGQYGDCAVLAVALIVENRVKDPCKGWECAVSQKIKSDSSQQKGCPKDVFLGLCEEGLVKGVAKGNYTGSVDNKDYAVKAVEILSRTIRPGNKITVKKNDLWR